MRRRPEANVGTTVGAATLIGGHAQWRFHALPHSAEALSVLTSFRASLMHPTGFLLASIPVVVLMPARPIDPVLITAYVCVGTLQHANLRWTFGPLGRVLVSPVYHRLHHATVTFFRAADDGYQIDGWTTAIEDGQMWAVSYAIRVDAAWTTRSARIAGRAGGPAAYVRAAGLASLWTLADHRSIYVKLRPAAAGHAMVTVFVYDELGVGGAPVEDGATGL